MVPLTKSENKKEKKISLYILMSNNINIQVDMTTYLLGDIGQVL